MRRPRRYGAIDLPQGKRHDNWEDADRAGSCVWCSMVMSLHAAGMDDQADYLQARYAGGAWPSRLHDAFDALGWDYAATTDGDVALLDWCDRTGRPAGVTFKDSHFCVFLGWENRGDGLEAKILDPNDIDQYEYYPRDWFIEQWRAQGGWATAIVAAPVPSP